MAEELKVVLKKSENLSFGFSLLGTAAGLPHVIYDIMENSPAAECGEVSTNSLCLPKYSIIIVQDTIWLMCVSQTTKLALPQSNTLIHTQTDKMHTCKQIN